MSRRHPALVRDDTGGLAVRGFKTAEEASDAAQARELTTPTGKGWTPARLGKELGLSKRTINRRCESDELPFVDHGTATQPRRIIPAGIVKLVKLYGLGGVARMRKAGQL